MKRIILFFSSLIFIVNIAQGQTSILYYHSSSNMHIEVGPGMYIPDTFYLHATYLYWQINDYINELTIDNDIDITNLSGNDFCTYTVASLYFSNVPDSLCYRINSGKFFFTGNSDIDIDTGIILNSGSVYYCPLYIPNIPPNTPPPGPGGFSGVCWPANFYSSGPNQGSNSFPTNPYTFTAHRDYQYPKLVAMNRGDSIWDANVLDFDFIPKGRYIKLEYVFGSEEYGQDSSSCTYPTDVMGIFISGPGFSASKNIAVLPGTNTPINPHTVYPAFSPCRGEDTVASPYYVDNTGGQNIAFDGFTKVMTAWAKVTPCDTYHLRIAVADGAIHPNDTMFEEFENGHYPTAAPPNNSGDLDSLYGIAGRMFYDSGIMLKNRSFRSTDSLWLRALGGVAQSENYPYAVRGCLDGAIRLHAATSWPIDRTYHLNFSGTAVAGLDYALMADSITIPAHQTSVDIPINALATTNPRNLKTLNVRLVSPYGSCYQMNNTYLDSTTLYISDGYLARIFPRDTVICPGCSFSFRVMGENFMTYNWTPATGLNNPNIKNPLANPASTTHYILTATPDVTHPCPGSLDSTWVYVGSAGINPNQKNKKILSVYPNPFKTSFQIQFKNAGKEIFELTIYNIVGKRLYRKIGTVSALNKALDIIGYKLNTGHYLLKLKNNKGAIYQKKVVKRQ